MALLCAYLRQRKWVLLLYLIFLLLYAAVFFFSSLPMPALIYPGLLSACMVLTAAIVDFLRIRRLHRQLTLMLNHPSGSVSYLPMTENILEQDYQQLIRRLFQEAQQTESDHAAQYQGTLEYYTLWAHQIKTPIAAMGLMLQNEDSALSRSLSPELGRIERYADMAMAYLRLNSPSSDYTFREYSLDALIRQSVKRLANEFILRRIRLDYEEASESLVTDEKWLCFVLEQLLSNALKYTHPGGTIRIEQPYPCTLTIRDNGIGIAPEDLPRVFEMGYTGHNGRIQRQASGIGLYLCLRICQRLNIRLSAQSKLGEGTAIALSWENPDLTKM